MKKLSKYKMVFLLTTLLAVVAVIVATSAAWQKKVERSGTEATQMLESEGITIRTVDTSKLVEKDEMNEEELEKEPEQTSSSLDTTEGTEQTSGSSDATADTEQTSPSKEQPTKPTDQTNNQQTTQENGQTNEKTAANAPAKEEVKSLVEIKQAYMGQFLTLESEISASLDAILEEALTDYQTKKANNEEVKVSEFQAKYATKVLNLEATSDSQFNEIYKQLEAELAANGYDPKEAQPYRAQYRAEKQNREQKAIEKFSSMR